MTGIDHVPNWLKILALVTLVCLGLPAAASAHGSQAHDEDVSATSGYAEASVDAIGQEESIGLDGSQAHGHFFETASVPAKSGHCKGNCCCCQGMSRCGSTGGCASSALDGTNALITFDPRATRVAVLEDQVIKHLNPSFGLERPPRG